MKTYTMTEDERNRILTTLESVKEDTANIRRLAEDTARATQELRATAQREAENVWHYRHQWYGLDGDAHNDYVMALEQFFKVISKELGVERK